MTVLSIRWRRSRRRIRPCVCAAGATGLAQERRGYAPARLSTVRAVAAEHGMVVAQERLAAKIGADILAQGGNAVDAAVATGFALAVTYPRAGNIGGGGFMLIHSADRNEDIAIDYRETAPGRDHARHLPRRRRQARPGKSRNSALGIGVPGTVAGLALALDKYGSGNFTLAQSSSLRSRWHATACDRRRHRRYAVASMTVWRAGRPRQRLFPHPLALRCARATGWSRPIWPPP